MDNLTKEQKAKIALEYMQENVHHIAVELMIKLGKMAQSNGVNLTYSAASNNPENPVMYRLHVCSANVEDKDILSQEYFVDMVFYSPRNNLERMLHEEFRKNDHTIISAAQIADLKQVYQRIVDKYQSNRGRATVEFNQNENGENNKWIRIGESIHINLIKVSGDFWTNLTRKEEQNG